MQREMGAPKAVTTERQNPDVQPIVVTVGPLPPAPERVDASAEGTRRAVGCSISADEIAALQAWIAIHPKTRGPKSWQNRLMSAWLSGHYGVDPSISGHLQTIRNRTNLPCDLTERIRVLATLAKP